MTQPTAPTGAKTYFSLTDADDEQPYAVAALNADGMPERFVPGKGLVDWPSLSGALLGFDPEAAREVKAITEEQAQALMAQNVGALPDSYVAANQGSPDGNDQAEPVDGDDDPVLSGGNAPPDQGAPDGSVEVAAADVKDLLATLRGEA